MKRILNITYSIVLIILLSYQIFATDWYVKNGGAGTNDGTSWTNAWTSFASINWVSIRAGDNIYIDGGTDSVVYAQEMIIGGSGSWNKYISILAGKYSPSPGGHSGQVIIDHNYTDLDSNPATEEYGIQIQTLINWIKIKGLTIRHTSNCGISIKSTAAGGAIANPSHIWIDSCKIYEVNANECIEIQGYGNLWDAAELSLMDTTRYTHHIEISRCNMWTHTNRAMPECNIIYGHLTGWLYIHHNILWERNLQQGGNSHIDPIQLAYSNHSVRIYNNIILNDSCVTGHSMILGLMSRSSNYYDTTVVYDNYVYSGGEYNCQINWKQEILWRAPEGGAATQYLPLVYSINNTIVARNGYTANSAAEGSYNPLESNNIIVHYGVNGSAPVNFIGFWYTTYSAGDYKQVDSNKTNLAYMAWGGVGFGGNHWMGNGGAPIGTPGSWADFINPALYGGSGVNADPQLINNTRIPTGNPFEISATSPAINAGTNMTYVLQAFEYLPMFDASTDILGNKRDANWDIGAYEYTTGGWTPPDTTATVALSTVTNAELNSYHIGSGVLSGADSTFHIWTTTADSFRVNSGTLNTTMLTAVSGNTLYIPVIASSQYSTSVTNYVVVSGTVRSFTVTTKAQLPIPPSSAGKTIKGFNGKLLRDSTGKIIKMR